MTCKDCKDRLCGLCEWVKSQEFKDCQHEHLVNIMGLDLYRCEYCGRVLSHEAIIEMVKGGN